LSQPPEWIYFWLNLGYFGVFVFSVVGTASIIIPVPYTLLIFWLGVFNFDPILLALAGGAGSAIGEFSGYLLGYYGRKRLSSERQRRMTYLVKLIGNYGPIAIFIFALTPLPDDLLFIPLGILRYKFVKAFIPALLGKILMAFIVSYIGRTGGQLVPFIFGESADPIITTVTVIVTSALLMLVLMALYKIDWEKVFEKYAAKRGKIKN